MLSLRSVSAILRAEVHRMEDLGLPAILVLPHQDLQLS
jgi:hypothetical protein